MVLRPKIFQSKPAERERVIKASGRAAIVETDNVAKGLNPREKRTWSKNLQEEDLAKESEKEYLETKVPEGAAHVPSWPHSEAQTPTPTITDHSSHPSPCHCRAYILLRLTGRLQQKLRPMVSNFYFGWPEINSVTKLTLCWLLYSIVAPDTCNVF